jgi:DNA-binding transcriptional regulator YdaS (Cro superfamily)
MLVKDLMARLGGQAAVARRLGVTRAAVSQWAAANDVPEARRLDVWGLALDADVDWTPPGAEALRDKLRAQPVRAA